MAFSSACCVENVAQAHACGLHVEERQCGPMRDVQPDRFARRCQRAVWQRHAQRLGHHLGRRGSAEKLAATARRTARPAAHFGSVIQADQVVREARANRLHGAGILGSRRGQRHPTRHDDPWQVGVPASAIRIAGKPLIAGANAHDPLARGQRPDEPPHRHRGVVAVGQAVEHAGVPWLRPSHGSEQ